MDPYYQPNFLQEMIMFAAPALVFSFCIFFAMFFALLLAGRRLMARSKPGPEGPSVALGIVRERYARGELSRQEFEQMKGVLEG